MPAARNRADSDPPPVCYAQRHLCRLHVIALEPLPTPALPSLAVAFETLLAETEPEVAYKLADLGVVPLKVGPRINRNRALSIVN